MPSATRVESGQQCLDSNPTYSPSKSTLRIGCLLSIHLKHLPEMLRITVHYSSKSLFKWEDQNYSAVPLKHKTRFSGDSSVENIFSIIRYIL